MSAVVVVVVVLVVRVVVDVVVVVVEFDVKQQSCSRQASAVIQTKSNLLNFIPLGQHITVHAPWSQLKYLRHSSGTGFLNVKQ